MIQQKHLPFIIVLLMLVIMCIFNFRLYEQPNQVLNIAIAFFSGVSIFLGYIAFVKK
jgi:hypothetical protein